jgi:hypothetical protein
MRQSRAGHLECRELQSFPAVAPDSRGFRQETTHGGLAPNFPTPCNKTLEPRFRCGKLNIRHDQSYFNINIRLNRSAVQTVRSFWGSVVRIIKWQTNLNSAQLGANRPSGNKARSVAP